MKRVFLIIFLLCATTVYSKTVNVVLTGFQAYNGRSVNNSLTVISELKKKLSVQDQIKVSECILPVLYDTAAVSAIKCIEKFSFKPDYIFSIGEGSCNLRFETMASNHVTSPDPDASGLIKLGQKINPEGADKIGFMKAVADMYCSVDSQKRDFIKVSTDLGGFVCNDLSYRLAQYAMNKNIPYAFIHVPAGACDKLDYTVDEIINTPVEILHQSLTYIFSEQEKSISKDRCSAFETTKGQVLDVLTDLMKSEKNDNNLCKKEFYLKFGTALSGQ